MQEFIEIISSLPTVLFTVPLVLSLLYWAFVLVGAADVDLLGGAEGALEAGGEGLAEGAAEGVADAAGEGLAWLTGALKLRSAPVTVVGSLFSLSGWLLSFFGTTWLADSALPSWATATLVGAAAFGGALFATSLAVRPLAPIFEHTPQRGGRHLVGKTCVIRSGRVNERSGQAEIDDGGAGVLVHVRATPGKSALKRGDEALVIDYDVERNVYLVEPLKELLGQGGAHSVAAPDNDKAATRARSAEAESEGV